LGDEFFFGGETEEGETRDAARERRKKKGGRLLFVWRSEIIGHFRSGNACCPCYQQGRGAWLQYLDHRFCVVLLVWTRRRARSRLLPPRSRASLSRACSLSYKKTQNQNQKHEKLTTRRTTPSRPRRWCRCRARPRSPCPAESGPPRALSARWPPRRQTCSRAPPHSRP
jgi:hypothetical protein